MYGMNSFFCFFFILTLSNVIKTVYLEIAKLSATSYCILNQNNYEIHNKKSRNL